jgi:superfamily II DNA or RNA helicase
MTNLSHWNDIETHLSTADNQTKGELFEQLTEHFLRWSPKYQVILKHVWRLKDVPTNIREKLKIPNQDQGIDLIAESYEGKYWAIQCKYHGDYNKKISHREISTFLALSNAVASNIDFCLVATTADDYAQLYKGQNNIGFILSDTWTQLPASFFDQFRKKEIVKTVTRNPRPHQKDAIVEAKKHFKVETRGKLIFPCGAGKSLTGYWITKELKAKTVIVAVPSLALVKQTLEDYCQESFAEGNPIAPFCICSDEGIGKNDDVAVFTQDLGVVCTTDKVKILDFLNFKTKRTKVLFTTYQSGRVLGDAVNEVNFKFDVGIMDESHKTVGATDKLFSHLLFDENVAIKKRIFMTATERRYKGSSENILSMDDPSVYGDTFTQLSFKEAIHQEILSDYKILTLVITQAEIKEYLNKNDFVKALGLGWEKDIDFRTLSSLVALRKAMQKFPIKHAVTFHSSIKRAKVFEQLQPIFDQAFPAFESVDAFHVTGTIPASQRSKIIAEFSQSDRGIITNAKCLTEGVDVPNIDCVLFADPRKSSIDIVQAVGRALRRSKGKDFGYVLLPVFAESNDKESIIESEDFQAILQTLRALASNDERIIEYFREKQKSEKKSEKSDLVQFEIDEIIGNVFATDELLSQLDLKAWSRLAKLSWRPFEEAREFVRTLELNSREEYIKLVINKKYFDLPLATEKVYEKSWLNWPDYLGNNRITETNKISYLEAQRIVKEFNFNSQLEFKKWVKNQKIYNIPITPERSYKEQGWNDWGTFLGNDKNRTYLSYGEAKKWAMESDIVSAKQWKIVKKKNLLPKGIPGHPQSIYKNKGWQSWSLFLGTSNLRNIEYINFVEARKYVRKLKLKSTKEWKIWTKNHRPFNIPGAPDAIYKEKGWISWADFLGADIVVKGSKLDYDEAKKILFQFCIKSSVEWRTFVKSDNMPDNIPTNPDREYKNKGWKGWADFLGKEDKE